MKKFLCFATVIACCVLVFSACDGTDPAPETTKGTTTATPEISDTTVGTESETVQPTETTETTPETTADTEQATESTEPSVDKAPVIVISDGAGTAIDCFMYEKPSGLGGDFELTERYEELPVIHGTSFTVSLAEENSNVTVGTYLLYDSDFESLGMIRSLEQMDYNFGEGTYYVRITVNDGWGAGMRSYYAYAVLAVEK